jgi:PAS domain S-box-containing protein
MDRDDILAPVRLVLLNIGIAGAIVWTPMFIALLWATGRLQQEWAQTQQEAARAHAAEAAERESEARTRMIIETALDALIAIDVEGRVTEWNAQAHTMFGWSCEEVIGESLSSKIIPAQYRDAHEAGLKRYLKAEHGPVINRRIEVTARHRDGHEFPVEVSISPTRIAGTYTFSAFVRDVTERKLAETQLRESEEQYRSVVTALEDGVILADHQGVIQACNASAERILGVSAGRLLQRSLHDPYWQAIHEDGTAFPSVTSP